MKRLAYAIPVMVAAVLFAASPARLTLAFEDRGDPRPHQVALQAEVAGLAMALVVSWSERARQLR